MTINYSAFNQAILQQALTVKSAEIAAIISEKTKNTVQDGPFTGMKLPAAHSWGMGEVSAKLLGTYEQELHVPVYAAIERKPSVIFNVGCAEGYYAVGLARALSESTVIAIDTDPRARDIAKQAALLNGVSDHFVTEEAFNYSSLQYLLPHERGLIVMDVEGAEVNLIGTADEEIIPRLTKTDLIIECHNFKDPAITSTLVSRLTPSHDCRVVKIYGRNTIGIPLLEPFGDFERSLAVCEWRPSEIEWLVAWSPER